MGVTDSHGTAYDFDQYGLHVSTAGWRQCIAINFMEEFSSTVIDNIIFEGDDMLQSWALEPNWTSARLIDE